MLQVLNAIMNANGNGLDLSSQMANQPIVTVPNRQFLSHTGNNVVLDDDEFFHITCHIDKSLSDKIKNSPIKG